MVSLAPPARVRVWSASLGGLGGRERPTGPAWRVSWTRVQPTSESVRRTEATAAGKKLVPKNSCHGHSLPGLCSDPSGGFPLE